MASLNLSETFPCTGSELSGSSVKLQMDLCPVSLGKKPRGRGGAIAAWKSCHRVSVCFKAPHLPRSPWLPHASASFHHHKWRKCRRSEAGSVAPQSGKSARRCMEGRRRERGGSGGRGWGGWMELLHLLHKQTQGFDIASCRLQTRKRGSSQVVTDPSIPPQIFLAPKMSGFHQDTGFGLLAARV